MLGSDVGVATYQPHTHTVTTLTTAPHERHINIISHILQMLGFLEPLKENNESTPDLSPESTRRTTFSNRRFRFFLTWLL